MAFVQMIDQCRILQIGKSLLTALPQKKQQSGLDVRIYALQRNNVDTKLAGTTASLEAINENQALTGSIAYSDKRGADTA